MVLPVVALKLTSVMSRQYSVNFSRGMSGSIRYSQSIDGYLLVQGDLNHDGKADFSLLVHNTALVASDFSL